MKYDRRWQEIAHILKMTELANKQVQRRATWGIHKIKEPDSIVPSSSSPDM
jgi:hypothetical protein